MKPPDEARTVLVRDQDGKFKGQATYWKRDGIWELIGVTRSVNWLHEVPFENVESEAAARGWKAEWVKPLPFV